MSGGPPANPLMMKLCDLLEDRSWHPAEPILREVGKLVPPGKAIRRAELRRRATSRNEERTRPTTEDRLIASGRRSYARDAISAGKTCFETKFDGDGVELIRMVSVPPRVARDRARARAHFHFVPSDLVNELRDGAPASALLNELSHKDLLKVALELATRERARHLAE